MHIKLFAMFGAFIHELCDANLRNLDPPTHITYYGDALVNETNTIPPSTILKISPSQSALSTIHSSTV